MDSKEPFSTREMLSLFFPEWLVNVCGPYPDEVGFWPVFLRWLALGLAVLLPLRDLVPEQHRTASGVADIVTGSIGLAFWYYLYRTTRDE